MYAILVFILALILGIYLANKGVNIKITIKHEFEKEEQAIDKIEEDQQKVAISVAKVMQDIMGVSDNE